MPRRPEPTLDERIAHTQVALDRAERKSWNFRGPWQDNNAALLAVQLREDLQYLCARCAGKATP